MGVGRLVSITLDCADPEPEAQFWAAMLDGKVAYSNDEWTSVETPGGLYVSAYRVEGYEPPSWPDDGGVKQFHVDVGVDDLDEGERAALELGFGELRVRFQRGFVAGERRRQIAARVRVLTLLEQLDEIDIRIVSRRLRPRARARAA